MAQRKEVDTTSVKIFINCPFDKEYEDLLRPMVFVLVFLGFKPLIASQRSDSGETRMDKILKMIQESDHSIHDISRVVAKKSGESFRFNMPFELGIDWGFKRINKNTKQFLILGGTKYSISRALSDIGGCDPVYHENNPEQLVPIVRDWLKNMYPRKHIVGPSEVWDQYNFFLTYLRGKSYSDTDVERMQISEYIDNIQEWLNTKK